MIRVARPCKIWKSVIWWNGYRTWNSSGGRPTVVTTAESGATKLPTVGMVKRNMVHQIQSGAASATAGSCSSQITVTKTDDGAKEKEFDEKVQEDTERGRHDMTINQLSMDGTHSLVVDYCAYVHVCPKSYASHAPLQSLPEPWRRLDLRSASGKMLKVWGMREVAYDAQDLNGNVFTVRIPFVVREVRRPLLSLDMLEDKGFHMTVKDGCRILGRHGWSGGVLAKTRKFLSC